MELAIVERISELVQVSVLMFKTINDLHNAFVLFLLLQNSEEIVYKTKS